MALAAWVERANGVALSDVRFTAADGTRFSALLYRRASATPQTPEPGVLAVHGYINTRETQDAFAIEFARRGYVVLALDQRGHGYSGGAATHPGDHWSTTAVADAADWFTLTLKGGRPRVRTDQIWRWKEVGTGLALLGLAALALGVFDALLRLPPFSRLRSAPASGPRPRDARWWALLALTALTPAANYYLLPLNGLFKPTGLLPQSITNTLAVWALLNGALGWAIDRWLGLREIERAPPQPWALSAGLAVIVVGVLYLATLLASLVQVDFRFWVVVLKPLSARQAVACLSYVAPFTLFTCASFRGLDALAGDGSRAHYAWACAALAAGFALLTGLAYAGLFTTGALPAGINALSAIVAIQFVPLLLGFGILAVHLAAYGRLGPGRPDRRTVRHLVRGRRHGHTRGVAIAALPLATSGFRN